MGREVVEGFSIQRQDRTYHVFLDGRHVGTIVDMGRRFGLHWEWCSLNQYPEEELVIRGRNHERI